MTRCLCWCHDSDIDYCWYCKDKHELITIGDKRN